MRRESLLLVYAPLEDKVAAYGALEQAQLAAELSACQIPSGPATCAEDLAPQMAAAAKAAFAVLSQAVPRCLGLTGGAPVRRGVRGVWLVWTHVSLHLKGS